MIENMKEFVKKYDEANGFGTEYDKMGRPLIPDYRSILNGATYNELKSQVTNKGLNPWSAMAMSRQNKLAQGNIEEAINRVAGQTATSNSKLASQGGLTSGARERNQQAGQGSLLGTIQDINKQKDLNSLQIGAADAASKEKAMSQLGQMEMTNARDINQYNMDKYKEQMSGWAANKQAQATASSGGGKK